MSGAIRGHSTGNSRSSRRVFAKKSNMSMRNISTVYFLRGGGYL